MNANENKFTKIVIDTATKLHELNYDYEYKNKQYKINLICLEEFAGL